MQRGLAPLQREDFKLMGPPIRYLASTSTRSPTELLDGCAREERDLLRRRSEHAPCLPDGAARRNPAGLSIDEKRSAEMTSERSIRTELQRLR